MSQRVELQELHLQVNSLENRAISCQNKFLFTFTFPLLSSLAFRCLPSVVITQTHWQFADTTSYAQAWQHVLSWCAFSICCTAHLASGQSSRLE